MRKKNFVVLFLAVICVHESYSKVFEPCELAKLMIEKYRFPRADIADCK